MGVIVPTELDKRLQSIINPVVVVQKMMQSTHDLDTAITSTRYMQAKHLNMSAKRVLSVSKCPLRHAAYKVPRYKGCR